jgi:hypothetical protein
MSRIPTFAVSAGLLVASFVTAGEPFKSGPQPGATVPGCPEPTVLVFARELSEPMASLAKRIDDKLIEKKARELRCRGLIIWLSDDEELPAKVKALAHKQPPKRVESAFDSPDGWKRSWGIAKEAEVTIVLYVKRKVQASYAFRAGEFDEKAIGRVLRNIDDRLIKQGGPD